MTCLPRSSHQKNTISRPLICFGFLLGIVLSAGCKKSGDELASPPAFEEAPQGTQLRMQQVSIPLVLRNDAGAIQEQGSALIQFVSVGAGKHKGGLMKVLAPAIQADATSIEIDGDDLRILTELSSALRSLVPLQEIQFRGFSVVRTGGEMLLQCSRASVAGDEEWKFEHVRLHGGEMQSSFRLKLAARRSPQKALSTPSSKNSEETEWP